MRRAVLGALLAASACASEGRAPAGEDEGHYLRWVAVEVPIHEFVLIRWPDDAMPLRVSLPRPPEGLFDDPDAMYDSVRDGVVDWTDVAAPSVPSFVFVDDPGQANVSVQWAERPIGNEYLAFCQPHVDPFTRRIGPAHVLVKGRWPDGKLADLHSVYLVVLHEMGHALGLLGHSPTAGDVMVAGMPTGGLSERDRATLRALYARPNGTRVVGSRRGNR